MSHLIIDVQLKTFYIGSPKSKLQGSFYHVILSPEVCLRPGLEWKGENLVTARVSEGTARGERISKARSWVSSRAWKVMPGRVKTILNG